jgi:Family of unknown function (DUF5908)
MPLEIKELQIKVTLSDNASAQAEGGGSASSGAAALSGGGGSENEAIVDACVDKVLAILKEKMER